MCGSVLDGKEEDRNVTAIRVYSAYGKSADGMFPSLIKAPFFVCVSTLTSRHFCSFPRQPDSFSFYGPSFETTCFAFSVGYIVM